MRRFHRLRILGSVVLFFFLIPTLYLYAWPFGGKNEQKKSGAPISSNSSSGTNLNPYQTPAPPKDTSQEEVFFDDFEAEEPTEEAPLLPDLPKIPFIPKNPAKTGIPQIPSVPKVTMKSFNSSVPGVTSGRDPELVRIQTQIDDIIKINENLKSVYSEQAAEIQKIGIMREQVTAHQRGQAKACQNSGGQTGLSQGQGLQCLLDPKTND